MPQGSILGPILFLVYINDLPTGIHSNIKLYADDTSLYVAHKDPIQSAQTLQQDLDTICAWAKTWKVKFNPDKTERMVITRKANVQIPELKMDGHTIKIVKEHKHLGITLQSNGKWNSHIREITVKAKRKVDNMRGLMYKLDRITLEKMYMTFVRPILEYGSMVWLNCQDKDKKLLEDVQLEAARVVTSAVRGTSHQIIYDACNWETLEKRRNTQQLVNMYKLENNLLPPSLTSLLPGQINTRVTYNLRNKSNIIGIQAKSNAYKNSFLPSAIQLWNNLDPDTRNLDTLGKFKKKMNPEKHKIKERHLVGHRKGQIVANRMRMGHSSLNNHLFQNHILETPDCECGHSHETLKHFFFDCTKHVQARHVMMNSIPEIFEQNVNTYLYGCDDINEQLNKELLVAVTTFIVNSGRFS